jgi:hypothetical protein
MLKVIKNFWKEAREESLRWREDGEREVLFRKAAYWSKFD